MHDDYEINYLKRSIELNVIIMETLINSLCSEVLLRLSLNFVSPEIKK